MSNKQYMIYSAGQSWTEHATTPLKAVIAAFRRRPPKYSAATTQVKVKGEPNVYMYPTLPLLRKAGVSLEDLR